MKSFWATLASLIGACRKPLNHGPPPDSKSQPSARCAQGP